MRLLIATRNQGKVAEISAIMRRPDLEVLSLKEVKGEAPEVIEDGETFLANARKKALAFATWSGLPALADDSGLVVDTLGGRPGVLSSRYASAEGDAEANMDLLLREMEGVPDGARGAHFVCVMCLALPNGRTWEAVGRVDGRILRERRGHGGFGYDPVFFYPPAGKSFAEMGPEAKNAVSHRRRALDSLASLLPEILRQV